MKKVFVSSKQGELDPERDVLHRALQSAEWDNFVIEFAGAFPDNVRSVFLKNVAECDVYLGIFARIYSQPTVDEYHKAKELDKPILIYLKRSANRDPQLEDFIRTELQPSHKYQEFSTTEELISYLPNIHRALEEEVQKHQRQMYLDALVAQTEMLELAGIVDTGEQEHPKLQEIFVALSTVEEVEEHDERQSKDKREAEPPVKITRRVTINEALRDHRNLMILGDPGAGKSTLLRYLTLVAALNAMDRGRPKTDNERVGHMPPVIDQDLGLPILIRLSSFALSGQSFVEYFETYAKTQLYVSLGEKFFERALEDGHTIVCMDGLDEVSQPAQRIEVRNAIVALSRRYPRNRFIVASRIAGYENTSPDKSSFAYHTIVPLGEREIRWFVEKWYASRERGLEPAKSRATSLFDDLKGNERLLKLAENPLMLTIIALVHQHTRGKLPDARVELYDRCAKTLIEKWDEWRGLKPEDKDQPFYRRRRHWLERTAYWMHFRSQDGGAAQVNKHALEKQVAKFLMEDEINLPGDIALDQAEKFIALAMSRTGILVEREQDTVSFIHLTFQEYFAASDLYWRYRGTTDMLWRAIQPNLYDSRWQEVILLLLGRLNDDGDTSGILVGKIRCEHDKFDDVVHRDLFLSARCLAEQVNVLESLQNEIVDSLLQFAVDRDPKYHSLRDDAIQTLGTLRGNKHAGEGLLTLAYDKLIDANVRSKTALALGQLGCTDNVVVRGLLMLAQDRLVDASVRSAATKALGQSGCTDDAVLLGLLALAQDTETYYEVRSNAAKALGQLGCTDDRVIQGLLMLTRNKEDSRNVRGAAEEALGQLGRTQEKDVESDVRFAMALVHQAKLDSVRLFAARWLGKLGRTDDATHVLLELAQDQKTKVWVRCDAARALEQLGLTDDALRLLLGLVQDAKTEDNDRGYIIQTLGHLRWRDDAVIQVLLAIAQDIEMKSYVRNAAAKSLGQLGCSDDAARLLRVLTQDAKVESEQRCFAAEELGLLGFIDEALEMLLAIVQDRETEGYVQRNAIRALGNLGQKDARVAWALLKMSINEETRNEVYIALKQVVGNMRCAVLDNGQNRSMQTGKKTPKLKSKTRNEDKRR